MNFKYRVRNTNGSISEGTLEAENKNMALQALHTQIPDGLVIGLDAFGHGTAAGVRRGSDGGAPGAKMSILDKMRRIGTVPAKKKMVFFRQMATMIKAGLGVSLSVDIAAAQENNMIFKDVLIDVKSRMDRGIPFSQAMLAHPSIFSNMMISLVQSGEEGGVLDNALERVAALLEKQEALKSKIHSAMFYPSFVILFAIAVVVVFIMFILPNFQLVFDQMEIELPALTQAMFALGEFCSANWRGITLISLTIVALFIWLFTSRRTKPVMDRVKLKLPVFGPLISKSAMARATQTLAALVSAGVPILRGLEMAETTADNEVISKGFAELQDATKQGQALGDAAQKTKIFPLLVCQMMRIGEETGHLDEMLERVATWFYQELDEQIRIITSLIEPVMIVIVGGLVAIIAMAIFGPITSAISQMG